MEQLRICHVVNIINGKCDGTYTHLRMLFQYLDGKKYKQYLIFQGNDIVEHDAKKYGVEVFCVPSINNKIPIKAFYDILQILVKHKIDIIQAHLLKAYFLVGFINIILRRKAIFNYHGYFISVTNYYPKYYRIIFRVLHRIFYVFKSYDLFLVPSHSAQSALVKENRHLPPIMVYYNGYPEDDSTPKECSNLFMNVDKTKYSIGVIGRFEEEKRLDIVLQIANVLVKKRDDVHFYLIGEGSLEDDIRKMINTLELQNHVSIIGYIKNIKHQLSIFDLILITSEREGFPFVVWEAMANGVPIVSSDVGGIPEILTQENCGHVYQFGNVSMATTLIEQLLDNIEERKRMGMNGKRAIQEKYNYKNFQKRFDEIYQSIVTRKL